MQKRSNKNRGRKGRGFGSESDVNQRRSGRKGGRSRRGTHMNQDNQDWSMDDDVMGGQNLSY